MAERRWGLLITMVVAMLSLSGLCESWWGEAMLTAVYILNRLPCKAIGGDLPLHRYFDNSWSEHADLRHLRVFGCRAYVHIEPSERNKFSERAKRGIMLGYDATNPSVYRILVEDTGKVVMSAHVTFNEREFPAKTPGHPYGSKGAGMQWRHEATEGDEPSSDGELEEPVGHGEPVGAVQPPREPPDISKSVGARARAPPPSKEQEPQVRRSGRTTQASRLCQDIMCPLRRTLGEVHAAHVASAESSGGYGQHFEWGIDEGPEVEEPDPQTFEQIKRSPNAARWRKAMQAEMDAQLRNETWVLVPRTPQMNVLGTRWHCRTKRDKFGKVIKYKVRWVAQGCGQVPGVDYDEVFAPVARGTSLRMLIAIAAAEDMELDQMDVVTAFLQASIDEEVYVRQPKGFEQLGPGGVELVCRLLKSLYGLKQSSRNWNITINVWLIEYGFKASELDPCIYVKGVPGKMLIIALYVDDLVIAGHDRKMVDDFKAAISARFEMVDLGKLEWLLGMEVVRDRDKGTIEIKQKAYLQQMLRRYKMDGCSSVSTPVIDIVRVAEDGEDDSLYRSAVGSILYASIMTRPDLAFAVSMVTRHLGKIKEDHRVVLKRIFRYIQGTLDLGIMYGARSKDTTLVGYCDADWANEKDTRRSTAAHVLTMAGGAVSWRCKLAGVATSSTEAEYVAAFEAGKDAFYLRQLLADMLHPQEEATTLYEDNKSCIAIAYNPVITQHSKHIEVRFHYIRQLVKAEQVSLVYIPTAEQIADMLTKPLEKTKFEKFRTSLHGYLDKV
jgi:hypothetical protein